jgi:hypothetical protein
MGHFSSENIAMFLSMVHHWSTLAISVYAIARLLPQRMEFSQRKHLYESLQGFGMGVFSICATFFFNTCTIYSVGILPKDLREA